MSVLDVFKSRKSNKINDLVWQAVWEKVKTPPADEQKELYLVYVGTLLYATRYQAALAAKIEDTVAISVALQVVGKANFDAQMKDTIFSIFSADPDNPTAGYAADLNAQIAILAGIASSGGPLGGAVVDEALGQIQGMFGVLIPGAVLQSEE